MFRQCGTKLFNFKILFSGLPILKHIPRSLWKYINLKNYSKRRRRHIITQLN